MKGKRSGLSEISLLHMHADMLKITLKAGGAPFLNALGWNSCPSGVVMVLVVGSRLFLSAKTTLPCVHS